MRTRRRRAGAMWEGRPVISVATLPGSGLYVHHLGHPEGLDGVHRPTVPLLPGRPGAGASFTPVWLRAHLDTVDVVHVHGLPAGQDPARTRAAADIVHAGGRPLVVTGYHLSDPSGGDPRLYAAQLDALMSRADAVVTLTGTAAEEIRERWGVEATVLPHPHVVDFVRMRRRRAPRRGPLRVGIHLAGLRFAADPVQLVAALVRATGEVGDTELMVHVHEATADPGSTTYAPKTLREIGRLVGSRTDAALHLHRPLAAPQLWDHLSRLDVSVVPGLHGSHSIWPEACADLSTQALMPAGTHAAEQQPCLTYPADASPEVQADAVAAALRTAQRQARVHPSDPRRRWDERVHVAEALRAVYERLLGLDGLADRLRR